MLCVLASLWNVVKSVSSDLLTTWFSEIILLMASSVGVFFVFLGWSPEILTYNYSFLLGTFDISIGTEAELYLCLS